MQTIFKPIGITPIEYLKKYKEEKGYSKVCICGKLDPMASGELLVLIDDKCREMDMHLLHNKTYEFEILWGIQTDSDDILGFIENINDTSIDIDNIIKNIRKFIGKYNQNFHRFSAKYVKNNDGLRKPLWWWTINGRLNEIEMPKKQVELYEIDILEKKKINFSKIKKKILYNISGVEKKFRTDKIYEQWTNFECNKELFITKFRARVSSGFYIRQLVRDLCNNLNNAGLALSITRTKIHI